MPATDASATLSPSRGSDQVLRLVPLNLREANRLVLALHRHNGPLRGGHYFSIGLEAVRPSPTGCEDVPCEHAPYLVGAVSVGPIAARMWCLLWALVCLAIGLLAVVFGRTEP